MADTITKTLLKKYFEGNCTLDEKKQVLKYLEQDDQSVLDEYIMEQAAMGNRVESPAPLKKQFFDRLSSVIDKPEQRKIISWKPATVYRVAAGIVLLMTVGIAYWLTGNNKNERTQQLVTVSNRENFTHKIVLSDGTRVWLNPNSSISYNKSNFSDSSREVTMTGEAFFDVSHDAAKPFRVTSGNIITRVLGTAFNITAYKNEKNINVLLVRGRVQVSSGSQHLVLTPGQLLSYNNSSTNIDVHNVQVDGKMDAFTSGKMVFDNIPLSTAINRIADAYAVHIDFKDSSLLKNKMITGAYTRNTADEVLRRVLFIHGLKFKKKGEHEYIITD
ncbi:FecR domain-containing protein [Mucilaginibacter sp. cycad4]|uniref:FecR family protein n=1 Tax=Mucilaginibacter sp. cycad4 TaxID=3342096 RepID=UPI002AAAB28B|nr:FecR domain-containing protein [Mucilaginibacter gossypii]WPV00866.1 FecR domain-containing protein [Mucilaginibacter gossypii]